APCRAGKGASWGIPPSLAQDQLVAAALGRVGVLVVHQHRNAAAHGVLHAVVDDGVVGGPIGGRDQVEDHAVRRSDLDGLHAVADVLRMPVVPHAVPDAGDGMHGGGL